MPRARRARHRLVVFNAGSRVDVDEMRKRRFVVHDLLHHRPCESGAGFVLELAVRTADRAELPAQPVKVRVREVVLAAEEDDLALRSRTGSKAPRSRTAVAVGG